MKYKFTPSAVESKVVTVTSNTNMSTYGFDKTIHQNKELNIEVDLSGKVVGVWFRCLALPFITTIVDWDRENELKQCTKMKQTYHKLKR